MLNANNYNTVQNSINSNNDNNKILSQTTLRFLYYTKNIGLTQDILSIFLLKMIPIIRFMVLYGI